MLFVRVCMCLRFHNILPELTGDSLGSRMLVLVSGAAGGESDLGLEEEALERSENIHITLGSKIMENNSITEND